MTWQFEDGVNRAGSRAGCCGGNRVTGVMERTVCGAWTEQRRMVRSSGCVGRGASETATRRAGVGRFGLRLPGRTGCV